MRLHKTGGRKTAAAAARTLDYSSRSSSQSIIRQGAPAPAAFACYVPSELRLCCVMWSGQIKRWAALSALASRGLVRASSKEDLNVWFLEHTCMRSKYLMCAIFCNIVESDLWLRVIDGLHSDGLEWKRQPNEAFNFKAFSCCEILPSLTVLHKSLLFTLHFFILFLMVK
jgi:hypothetical protein